MPLTAATQGTQKEFFYKKILSVQVRAFLLKLQPFLDKKRKRN